MRKVARVERNCFILALIKINILVFPSKTDILSLWKPLCALMWEVNAAALYESAKRYLILRVFFSYFYQIHTHTHRNRSIHGRCVQNWLLVFPLLNVYGRNHAIVWALQRSDQTTLCVDSQQLPSGGAAYYL